MTLISDFPCPREAVSVWMQTKGQEEGKSGAKGISEKMRQKGNESDDVLSVVPDVEKELEIFPFSDRQKGEYPDIASLKSHHYRPAIIRVDKFLI